MTKRKIVWQENQLVAVARRSYIIKSNPLFSGPDVAAVRQAQKEVLRADLHRPIRSMQEVPRIIHMWKELSEQNYAVGAEAIQPIPSPPERARSLEGESTANLMRELVTRLEGVLDEDRLRRLVREEANRMLEAREPAM